jgi:hypothetical protein
MKHKEITVDSAKKLTEAIAANNDTGFLTEDLVKIAQAEQLNEWGNPQTADEFLAELDAIEDEYDGRPNSI